MKVAICKNAKMQICKNVSVITADTPTRHQPGIIVLSFISGHKKVFRIHSTCGRVKAKRARNPFNLRQGKAKSIQRFPEKDKKGRLHFLFTYEECIVNAVASDGGAFFRRVGLSREFRLRIGSCRL